MRRSAVLSLPLQLAFYGLTFECFYYKKGLNNILAKKHFSDAAFGPGVTSQTYIVSLDWTKICGPNWQFFDSTAEKQQKMC
jgi:hypothetical protein